jgi:hypothetical protein
VSNLLVQQLLERITSTSLLKFLTSDLRGIIPLVAKKLIECIGHTFDINMGSDKLDNKQLTCLVQVLRSSDGLLKSLDSGCLSSLGEYNLK